MRDTTADIIRHAENVFDTDGFTATGMDHIADAAGVSVRTLYKHVGSKSELLRAVLQTRNERFFASLEASDVAELFTDLTAWIEQEGSRGCFFLRAERETGGRDAGVTAAVTAYRERLRERIAQLASRELGTPAPPMLVDQILVLFEGATSASSYAGSSVVDAAKNAAIALMRATH